MSRRHAHALLTHPARAGIAKLYFIEHFDAQQQSLSVLLHALSKHYV